MKKTSLIVLIAAAFAGSIGVARADDKTSNLKEAYLGVRVAPVPPALYAQMPGILQKGEGLLVEHVFKDSPAAKAGVQTDDILTSYSDQTLYSFEQLVKLIRADKPAHEVALGYVRTGKSMSCKVTLGEIERPILSERSNVFRFTPDHRMREMFEEYEAKNPNSVWESFDAIKLTRTEGKNWRAEVEFRSKEGQKVSKVYTGTREEIRKAILAEKDLPANEQHQLLRALNLHDPVFELHFPRVDGFGPGSGN